MAVRSFRCNTHNVSVMVDTETRREKRRMPPVSGGRSAGGPESVTLSNLWSTCCLLTTNTANVSAGRDSPEAGTFGACVVGEV